MQYAKSFTAVRRSTISNLHVTVGKLGLYLEGMVDAAFASQFRNDRAWLAGRSLVEEVFKCERRSGVWDCIRGIAPAFRARCVSAVGISHWHTRQFIQI